jgi:hypothetical protein
MYLSSIDALTGRGAKTEAGGKSTSKSAVSKDLAEKEPSAEKRAFCRHGRQE